MLQNFLVIFEEFLALEIYHSETWADLRTGHPSYIHNSRREDKKELNILDFDSI